MNAEVVQTIKYCQPNTVQYSDKFVMATIVQHDGTLAGSILLVRTDDDTSWGERRQAWLWVVASADTQLGRTKNTWDALKSGCDAEPHPVELMCSLLHYMAAGVEARNNPDSENYGIFNAEITEWAYQNDSELASLDLDLTTWLEAQS